MHEMNKKSRSFEQAMGRLEQIVRAMERGDVPLEQSLQLFEEGTGLVRQCGKLLEEAEMKISKVAKGADGEPTETEFVENG